MNNFHFSGSTNNFITKVKGNKTNSLNKNTKLNQYLKKNRKINKSPTHVLNKSQNIAGAQNTLKTNIKNTIINKSNKANNINIKKVPPLQNLKNIYLANRNNYLIKINQFQHNHNNLSISKNNSLSNYFTKNCSNINQNLRRNNTNTNILSTQNKTNYNTHNNIYQNKSNLHNLKKSSIIKINDYLTDEFIINKNNNRNTSSLYPLVITEESKKKNRNDRNNKLKMIKTENVSNTFIKKSHASIKKLKASSTSIINKQNLIMNVNNKNNSYNTQNKSRVNTNILGNPTSSSGGNLSTEKTSGCARLDNFEFKIMNEIKELKKCKNEEIINKIKMIFEEVIDYLIPKESQNVLLILVKEITNINQQYFDNYINLKDSNENLKSQIDNYQKKYPDLANKLKKKEKEFAILKNEIENFKKEKEIKYNKENKNKKIPSVDIKFQKKNLYLKKLNMKNIDDLDALYFFDKIEYSQNEKKEIPKLNLEQKHIEKCIQKEIINRNEINLTPFQKIALQFDMSDT